MQIETKNKPILRLQLAYYGPRTIVELCFVRLATSDPEVEVFIYALLRKINEY
jgi:hypothetical protein